MKVYGHEITDEQIDRAWQLMSNHYPSGFSYTKFWLALQSVGVEGGPVSGRAADRLLQKARKQGRIRFEGDKWVFT